MTMGFRIVNFDVDRDWKIVDCVEMMEKRIIKGDL